MADEKKLRFTLGERMQKARRAAGMDQAEMAAALSFYGVEVSQTTISNWEQDRGMRDQLRVLIAWAGACGIDPQWLVDALREELSDSYKERVSDLDLRTIRCTNVEADQPYRSRTGQLVDSAA